VTEPGVPFGDYQYEVYLRGLAGERPDLPFSAAELEDLAREKLDPGAFGYVAGAAGSEDTARANLEAFRRWRIVPRMLRDVSRRDLSVELFGTRLPAPVLLAPIGVQSIVHPEAELAVARAAASVGVPMVLSTAASNTMEDVAAALGDTPRWFQLYWPRDRELAASLLRRAEEAGYSAVAVTLDTWLLGWRPRDLAQAYLPFMRGEGVANYFSDPVFLAGLERSPEEDLGAAVLRLGAVYSDPSVTWEDLAFLRETTRLPILLKGILHPDDGRLAVDAGMDGVIVSNHGGRQVDGAVAALDALPHVADAVGDDIPVLFDSGIRSGADAFKALALGARAVLLGRPVMWGLALGGEAGVRHVLRGFLAELDLTFALAGVTAPGELERSALAT
jgi:lactate 2-monooxygenase